MDTLPLKKEQFRLAKKILLKDSFEKINLVAGIETTMLDNDHLLAEVTLCKYPSFKIVETQNYVLTNPLPYKIGYLAYREMPAIIEAYNKLTAEPDLIIVKGNGINHPRKFGLATHLGLALNKPTIGVSDKLSFGTVDKGKIIFKNDILGFEVKTNVHSNPIYISPGNLISLGSTLDFVSKMIQLPHKMPEPLHLAHKMIKKTVDSIKKNKENKINLSTSETILITSATNHPEELIN